MNRRIASSLAFLFTMLFLAAPSSAYLIAQNLKGARATANLLVSRITVQVGAQWLDIEEEAEVEVVTTRSADKGPWVLEGTFSIPKGSAVTGCMLWNNDTLLMGKLRGKADAQHIFDSLVPPRDSSWARDPLLVEQTSDTVYGLHLFPFQTSGTRRFRLRYLVPLVAGQNELSIKPLAASFLTGNLPSQFLLRLRGKTQGVKIVRGTLVWPAELPSSQLVDLNADTDVRLRWPAGPAGDGTCAIKDRIDSGSWKGEFVLFTGKVPDSVLTKTALRSETVVLWRWISPSQFFDACQDKVTGEFTARCLNDYGRQAVQQADVIGQIAQRAVENAGKIGLVADEGMDDGAEEYPLTDSTTTNYRNLRLWLASITPDYLDWRVPKGGLASGSGSASLEISKNRTRFRSDVQEAGTMYSADSGVLRHLLVVTVGPTPVTGEFLQAPSESSLPGDVSVASSSLVSSTGTYDAHGNWVVATPSASHWPGVDVQALVEGRDRGNLVAWKGISLLRTRETLAGRLTLRSGNVNVSRDISVHSNGQGGLNTSLNVHGTTLGDTVMWSLYNEKGDTIAKWSDAPKWLRVDGDSVMPRLWGKSEAPLSPVFENKEYGPLFGTVDRFYSLLATPTDTVGKKRQATLVDSGVPFLSFKEIFPRQGYGSEGTPTSRTVMTRPGLRIAYLASSRQIHIGLEGIEAKAVEIRDLRGRLLASIGASQLEGRKSLDWRVPDGVGKGVLFVTVRTARSMQCLKVLVD